MRLIEVGGSGQDGSSVSVNQTRFGRAFRKVGWGVDKHAHLKIPKVEIRNPRRREHLPTFPLLHRNHKLFVLATRNCTFIGWVFGQLLEVPIDPPENISMPPPSDDILTVITFSCERHIVEERAPPRDQNPGILLQLLPSLGRRPPYNILFSNISKNHCQTLYIHFISLAKPWLHRGPSRQSVEIGKGFCW